MANTTASLKERVARAMCEAEGYDVSDPDMVGSFEDCATAAMNLILDEAAAYHDRAAELRKAAIDADPRASNVGMMKRYIQMHEEAAFAIRAMKDRT